jgi:hypothetical protein
MLKINYIYNIKKCHKKMHHNGNLEARKLISDAITAVPSETNTMG